MKIYQVGGAVRDKLRGQKPQDFDYVVTGTTPKHLLELGFQQVGKNFPVFLHPQTKEEYALARKEIKIGTSHQDFKFIFNPSITIEEDLARRDFTCNAIAFDPEEKKYIDPFNGRKDIKSHILRHINDIHFQEDPLRILRLCRFTAQLNFTPAPKTLKLTQQMTAKGMLKYLSPERIWNEIKKALEFPNFSKFLTTARQIGALEALLPEINELWNIPERQEHHPEQNTGNHILLALEHARDTNEFVRFGVLLHDIGKTLTPLEILPSHHQHEQRGLLLIKKICQRFKIPNHYQNFALCTCKLHMKFHKVTEMRIGTLFDFCKEIKHYNCNIEDYIAVCRCDFYGRAVELSQKQKEAFEQKAAILRQAIKILSAIHATDMINFYQLKKDEHFGKIYREYCIQELQKKLKKEGSL